MSSITTEEQAVAWYPNLDADDVRRAWSAAEDYVSQRVTWEGRDSEPPTDAPGSLVTAVHLMTTRLLQRRKSPEGVIGMDADGLGAVLVPRVDVDVQALIDPYRRAVLA